MFLKGAPAFFKVGVLNLLFGTKWAPTAAEDVYKRQHEDLLKIVNDTMPEETELYDLAELFKVFGDSTRIRILFVADLNEYPSLSNF